MEEVLVEPVEEVRFVKFEVQTPSNINSYRDFGSYEEAHAYAMRLLFRKVACSVWRLYCYDDGYSTRYSRQLLAAFK